MRTQRFWAIFIWVAVVIYAAVLITSAVRVLNERYHIEGVLRRYEAPYEDPLGFFYDPRDGTLLGEIESRYGLTLPALPQDLDGFVAALGALGVETAPCDQVGDALWPRLWLREGSGEARFWLQAGVYGRKPMIFLAHRGMFLPTDAVSGPCLALKVKGEPPW